MGILLETVGLVVFSRSSAVERRYGHVSTVSSWKTANAWTARISFWTARIPQEKDAKPKTASWKISACASQQDTSKDCLSSPAARKYGMHHVVEKSHIDPDPQKRLWIKQYPLPCKQARCRLHLAVRLRKREKNTVSLEKKARLKPCRLQLTVPLGSTYCKSMQIMPIRRKRSAGIWTYQ